MVNSRLAVAEIVLVIKTSLCQEEWIHVLLLGLLLTVVTLIIYLYMWVRVLQKHFHDWIISVGGMGPSEPI